MPKGICPSFYFAAGAGAIRSFAYPANEAALAGTTMGALRKVDLQAALRFVGAIADAGTDAALFACAGVEALPRLVASEITTLSVCDLASGRRHVVGSPGSGISAADRACFDRHFREHPLVRYHAGEGGRDAHRISDSQPFARFRHTALYSEYYRRIGIDHAVALPVQVDAQTLVSFVLNRTARDFSDRECALLDVVGEHLARQYRRVRAAHRGASDMQTLARLLEHSCASGDGGAEAEAARVIPLAIFAALPLTAREREVLRWLAAGKTDRDIAALLGCSHRTVQKHLERSYAKLGVETRTAAVMRALGVTVQ